MQNSAQSSHMPDFSSEEVIPDLHVEVPIESQDLAAIAAVRERSSNAPDPKKKSKLALAVARNRLWKPGRVLRVKFLDAGVAQVQIDAIMDAASEWTNYANLQFVVSSDDDAEVRITFLPQFICRSQIGTNALAIKPGQSTMTLGLFNGLELRPDYRRYVLHEFGHAIGCVHEHQTPAAGIKWNLPVVYSYYKQLCGWDVAQVNYNVVNVYAQASTNHDPERDQAPGSDPIGTSYTPFDSNSIMVYPILKSHTLDGYEVQWGYELSPRDKQFIASIYPKEESHG